MSDRQSIAEIGRIFARTKSEELASFIQLYAEDSRTGVIQICQKARRRLEREQKERARIDSLMRFERKFWSQYDYLAGIDEVGRGPLAGPVVTAAVILPKEHPILRINDSKKLSAKLRVELYEQIMEESLAVAVGSNSPERIDQINILQATYEAMRQAVGELDPAPQILLNDAVRIPQLDLPQCPIIQGDAKSISIGAASIIAKVTRDRIMEEYDAIYPQYHFAKNKGYGTKEHIEALRKYGPCPIHRASFIGHFV